MSQEDKFLSDLLRGISATAPPLEAERIIERHSVQRQAFMAPSPRSDVDASKCQVFKDSSAGPIARAA